MRISDWSSDVGSSDLAAAHIAQADESDGCHDSLLFTPARGCCASASFPDAGALFDKGGHAFLLVLGSDQYLEQAAFGQQPRVEPRPVRQIDHFLVYPRLAERRVGSG